MKTSNLYNWVFWFNEYEMTWYGIRRDRYVEFFSGPSATAVYFEGKDISEVIEQINSYETSSVNE
jgi:hypothetical protein